MTFSIVGRCERTGQLGVAVSTKLPAVGAICPFARAGAGAVASQSFVNPLLGVWGLEYLAEGLSAAETLRRLQERDPMPSVRQLGIVDRQGGSVAFTGEDCIPWCGHLTGPNFAAQGNLLVNGETVSAMAERFQATPELELAERLMLALEAGQAAGGDRRGRQSAALLVMGTEEYPLVSLRVDEHADPVAELRRVFEVAKRELFAGISQMPTRENPAGGWTLEQVRQMVAGVNWDK